MLIKNGLVWVGNGFERKNLYILNGKFVSKRIYEESADYSNDRPVVDATGLFIMPGFVDSHAHIIGTGMKLLTIDMMKENISELVNRVINSEDKFIIARGWEKLPDNQDLQAINAIEKPVVLVRKCGHVAWINNFLKKKIKSENNIIYEEKIENVWKNLGDDVLEFYSNAFQKGVDEFLRHGVTQVHSDDFHGISYNKLIDLLSSSKIRIFEKLCTTEPWNYEFGYFNNAFLGGIKLFADGSLGGKTAYMFESYLETSGISENIETGNFGMFTLPENIHEIISFAKTKKLQLNIHVIGDKALNEVIKLLESHNVYNARLIHLQFVRKEDFPKLKNYYLSIQPHFYFEDSDIVKYVRYEMAYPFLEMYKSGFHVAFSTDSPVSPADPKYVIESALRMGFTKEESIYLYTEAGSKMVGIKSGKIEEECNADFCLYENDPFESDPVEVYINGNKVWSKKE